MADNASSPFLYPVPSEAALQLQFVGKQIQDVAAPAVILDAAVIRRNCRLMLETAEHLGVGFRVRLVASWKWGDWADGVSFAGAYQDAQGDSRPGIQMRIGSQPLRVYHLLIEGQTTQLTRLQVGEDAKSVKLVASTVAEIENLLPWLLECRSAGKDVNVSWINYYALSSSSALRTYRFSMVSRSRLRRFHDWQRWLVRSEGPVSESLLTTQHTLKSLRKWRRLSGLPRSQCSSTLMSAVSHGGSGDYHVFQNRC